MLAHFFFFTLATSKIASKNILERDGAESIFEEGADTYTLKIL